MVLGHCSRVQACSPHAGYRHVPGTRTTVCRTGVFGDTVCATRRFYPSCDTYYHSRPRCYTYSSSSCDRAATSLFFGALGLGCLAVALTA